MSIVYIMATFEGASANNTEAEFAEINYDYDGMNEANEGDQLYLESVLPTAYDPTLQAFDTRGNRPKEYIGQDEYGFHPKPISPYENLVNNTDPYFTPELNYKRNNMFV